jgi:hypothetical protein
MTGTPRLMGGQGVASRREQGEQSRIIQCQKETPASLPSGHSQSDPFRFLSALGCGGCGGTRDTAWRRYAMRVRRGRCAVLRSGHEGSLEKRRYPTTNPCLTRATAPINSHTKSCKSLVSSSCGHPTMKSPTGTRRRFCVATSGTQHRAQHVSYRLYGVQ